jgi:hypothetical protein
LAAVFLRFRFTFQAFRDSLEGSEWGIGCDRNSSKKRGTTIFSAPVHGEFLFATQAWFHKSSIAADILGFEVSLDRQSIRPLGRC